MSKRIGEVLIQKGLLNGVQLERALKPQLILGGHLGTCLIEMGFVDEADGSEPGALGVRYHPVFSVGPGDSCRAHLRATGAATSRSRWRRAPFSSSRSRSHAS